MKHFDKWFIGIIIVMASLIMAVNIFVLPESNDKGRPYLVEAERVAKSLSEGTTPNLSAMEYVTSYELCDTVEKVTYSGENDYCIKNINGSLYRINYIIDNSGHKRTFFFVNVIMIISGLIIAIILLIIRFRIIKPFHDLEEVPYELSKGNLSIPLDEGKYKLFGKYIWGTNMLRENIEERRRDELELHREKKTVLLSLAHDIKTPLSVIKLNAQAIEKGLYTEKEKNTVAAKSIVEKVDEIGDYITQIVEATKDDFLKLEVNEGELYLSDLIDRIRKVYCDKFKLLKISFEIGEFDNCLLYGDIDRLEEVLQNLLENAIKYGDGKYIKLSFTSEEGCQIITVSNSGNTLPDDEVNHLFESFYRGSNAGNNQGNGLGMYICRKLMSQMKGDIFIHPHGNIFNVSLVIKMC